MAWNYHLSLISLALCTFGILTVCGQWVCADRRGRELPSGIKPMLALFGVGFAISFGEMLWWT